MTNYRSIVGGFFSSTPLVTSAVMPTSVRSNNPGAINGAAWERRFPGYVNEVVTTPGNATTIFETPEQGVAAWWYLMKIYRDAGAVTVSQIINRYGGGQDYSAYVNFVQRQTGFDSSREINLNDDGTLLAFAKAMFRYEAGLPKLPWSDEQILYGFKLGRSVKLAGKVTNKHAAGAGVVVAGGAAASAAHASGLHPAIVIGILLVTAVAAAIIWYVLHHRESYQPMVMTTPPLPAETPPVLPEKKDEGTSP